MVVFLFLAITARLKTQGLANGAICHYFKCVVKFLFMGVMTMQFLGIFFLMAFVLEILSIVFMAKLIGGWATLGLMILAVMFGSFLMRNNANVAKLILAGGFLKNGRVSWYELLLPIRLPVAGLLFLLPGFLSDVVGLLLLIPFKGKPIANQSAFYQQTFSGSSSKRSNDDDVIEGDFVVKNEKGDTQTKNQSINVIEHK